VPLMETIRGRRSIRRYRPDPVPREKLDTILEAANLAPSWKNQQCWRFIVVTNEEKRRAITKRSWTADAPVVIVGCARPGLSGGNAGQHYYMLDMGIAMEHIVLAAIEQGLGTCWIGGQFDEPAVKEALGVPDDVRVVALLPVGYPAEAPEAKDRKPIDEIVSHEKW
jgi:nitroreductase